VGFPGFGMIAYAMIRFACIAFDTKQSVAIYAKSPVAFLPIWQIIRQGWHVDYASVGVAYGRMRNAVLLTGWYGCTICIKQTSALATCLPPKLYGSIHDLFPFLFIIVVCFAENRGAKTIGDESFS
jgi:hypothetical protein